MLYHNTLLLQDCNPNLRFLFYLDDAHYSYRWPLLNRQVLIGGAVFCVPEPTFDPSIANCDFENGLCLYYQERAESKVWNRVSVKPNAYRIGDHTTGAGESGCTADSSTWYCSVTALRWISGSFKYLPRVRMNAFCVFLCMNTNIIMI